MIGKIYKSKFFKPVAASLAVHMMLSLISPYTAWALTGGPGQPETQSFEPIGTTEMVDPFTGDFSYNIPLIDVGGYPINLSYHSGITNDQEASCVGLGWSVNTGAITRGLRGLPDDFNGDQVVNKMNRKANYTVGLKVSSDKEVVGLELPEVVIRNSSLGVGVSYNNYNGWGADLSLSVAQALNQQNGIGNGPSFGVNASIASGEGLSVNPSLSFTKRTAAIINRNIIPQSGGLDIGLNMNSRHGLQGVTYKFDQRGQINTFGHQSYIPYTTSNTSTANASFSAKVGGQVFGLQGALEIGGYFNRQWYRNKVRRSPGFGYLYAHEGGGDKGNMLDFNRGHDGEITDHTPNIAYAYQTYDTYSVSGQGISGSFRPYRNDVGTVYDVRTENSGGGGGANGFDLSGGNLLQSGVTANANFSNGSAGKWTGHKADERGLFSFQKPEAGKLYEPVFFKSTGESVVESDPDFLEAYGGIDPVKIDIEKLKSSNKLIGGGTTSSLSANVTRNKRVRRNNVLSYLTAEEVLATNGGTGKEINYYEYKNFGEPEQRLVRKSMPRVDEVVRKPHHVSEMQVTRADGQRYIYSIPTYNIKQKEATFNVKAQGENIVARTGLVTNWSQSDAKPDENKQGQDHFYQSTELPPYANGYLLTGVVSPDYIDRTGNGLTPDDFGTYTKFNYIKWSDDYKWRTPYADLYYDEGIKGVKNDDKGSYTYGEKEIWYVHSVETRTHVAEFHYSKRSDSYSALGQFTKGNNTDSSKVKEKAQFLLKLDKISLYSKPELQSLNSGTPPVPIKEVHFEYDYSLCKGAAGAALENSDGLNDNVTYCLQRDANGECIVTNNQTGGKLTLRRLYFTYQGSFKGKFSPYEFKYCYENRPENNGMVNNYNYDIKAYNRWGVYKPVPKGVSLDAETGPASNGEFPYVIQTDKKNDDYASAWSLTTIILPSGSTIEVDYEADDYAYVQNKQAMQMMKIVGAAKDTEEDVLEEGAADKLYKKVDAIPKNHNILVFKLQEPIARGNEHLLDRYFVDLEGRRIENMYFRFLVNINPKTTTYKGKDVYAFVPGYCGIENFGLYGDNVNGNDDYFTENDAYKYGYVKLEPSTYNLSLNAVKTPININPISKAAWLYTKIYQAPLSYGRASIEDYDKITDFVDAFASLKESLEQAVTGYGPYMVRNGGGQNFVTAKSWIRTYSPTLKKVGGGCRVKKIIINDHWYDQLNDETAVNISSGNYHNEVYGQVYSYKVFNEQTQDSISSGVASYEPAIGGDENPFKEPIYFGKNNKFIKQLLAPDDRYYQEKPFCEALFPGPSVGYSHIEVKSIDKEYEYVNESGQLVKERVTKNRTGKVVKEFYTARDFPTIVDRTQRKFEVSAPNIKSAGGVAKIGLSLLGFTRSSITASQGYTIELNNMHGVEKATWVYGEEQDTPLSGTEYFYKSVPVSSVNRQLYDEGGEVREIRVAGPQKLINKVKTVGPEGQIEEETYGLDFDMTVDSRSTHMYSGAINAHANGITMVVGIFPIFIFSLFPAYSEDVNDFRSLSTLKVIQRNGILDRVVTHDLGAQISAENLLYDRETGSVLLTKTTNNFDDPVYSFTYPAHWMYDGMGQSYKNIGLRTENSTFSSIREHLVTGDQLVLTDSDGNSRRVWVVNTKPELEVYDENEELIDPGVAYSKILLIRSGRQNMASTPVGSIISLKSPVDENEQELIVARDAEEWKGSSYAASILDAGAIEFGSNWRVFCNCVTDPVKPAKNTVYAGRVGNWRPLSSYLYLTTRKQDVQNHSVNVRKDGRFETFSPFWNRYGDTWNREYNALFKWTWNEQITLFSQRGQELENKDALYRRSAAIFRYSDLLPSAVANNAYYQEIGNDHFEDYNFPSECQDDHFSFMNLGGVDTREESHTGKYSLTVGPGKGVKMIKPVQNCEPKEVHEPEKHE